MLNMSIQEDYIIKLKGEILEREAELSKLKIVFRSMTTDERKQSTFGFKIFHMFLYLCSRKYILKIIQQRIN